MDERGVRFGLRLIGTRVTDGRESENEKQEGAGNAGAVGWNNVISEAAARSCMGRWMGNELMVGSVFRKRWERQRRDNAVRPCQGRTLRLEEH